MDKFFLLNVFSGFLATLILASNSYAYELRDFVVFGIDSVTLSRGIKVRNGFVGSNGSVEVERDGRMEADVFGNRVSLSRETAVAGSAHFNQLQAEKGAVILGDKLTPVALPIVTLALFPTFPVGQNNLIIPKNSSSVIEAGNFRNIEVGVMVHQSPVPCLT